MVVAVVVVVVVVVVAVVVVAGHKGPDYSIMCTSETSALPTANVSSTQCTSLLLSLLLTVVGVLLQLGDAKKFLRHMVSKAWILVLK